jgi:hypothetical protein
MVIRRVTRALLREPAGTAPPPAPRYGEAVVTPAQVRDR